MTEPLVTYLNDHLGGAQIAIQVLEAMRDQHDEENFREFAKAMLGEVQSDDRTLRSIAEKIGPGPSTLKAAAGWVVEKLSRLKLGHTGSADFEMFESLEMLALGIQGKLCLWKALRAASAMDPRLSEYNFAELIRRAEEQYEMVEGHRLTLAQTVLAPQTLDEEAK